MDGRPETEGSPYRPEKTPSSSPSGIALAPTASGLHGAPQTSVVCPAGQDTDWQPRASVRPGFAGRSSAEPLCTSHVTDGSPTPLEVSGCGDGGGGSSVGGRRGGTPLAMVSQLAQSRAGAAGGTLSSHRGDRDPHEAGLGAG